MRAYLLEVVERLRGAFGCGQRAWYRLHVLRTWAIQDYAKGITVEEMASMIASSAMLDVKD